MDIALISPKGVKMGRKEEMDKTARIYADLVNIDSLQELMSCPNSPLLTIAAMATPYFDQIAYIDEETEEIDWSRRYDMVGMSFMTQQASRAYELADAFRARGVYTICGGMHPTNLPGQTLEHFDTVFIGEGEHTWPLFMQDYREGRPRRLYRNDRLVEMSEVLQPRYDLLDFSRYRTIPVQISRGCPHNCDYCALVRHFGRRVRTRSPENVVADIRESIRFFHRGHVRLAKDLWLTDDNFFADRDWAMSVLRAIVDSGIRYRFNVQARYEVGFDDEMLDLLRQAGFFELDLGIEFLDDASFATYHKKSTRQEITDAIRNIRAHGLSVRGLFILGSDDQEAGVGDQLADFVIQNHIQGTLIQCMYFVPGTPVYEANRDRLLHQDWSKYNGNAVHFPRRMTPYQLQLEHIRASRKIYSWRRLFSALVREDPIHKVLFLGEFFWHMSVRSDLKRELPYLKRISEQAACAPH